MSELAYFVQAPQDDTGVLRPVGQLDSSNVDALKCALADAGAVSSSRVILDLSDTEFLDSMSIGALIAAYKQYAAQGGWLRIACANSMIEKVLRMTGIHEVCPLFATLDDALFADDLAGEPA